MKTNRELKTLDWSGHFFKEMVNILDIDPEYFMVKILKVVKMVQYYLIYVTLMKMMPHILFLTILNVFLKRESIVI